MGNGRGKPGHKVGDLLEVQCFYGFQGFVGMVFGFDFGPYFADDAIFVDKEGGTVDTHELLAVHVLLSVDAVEL
jgi:hypothetical protein